MLMNSLVTPVSVISPIHASCPANYGLVWRQRQLIVQSQPQPRLLPPLNRRMWIIDCLQRSPVKLIKLDLALGEEQLRFWAEAGALANKPAYLRLKSSPHMPAQRRPLRWLMKRSCDWLAALGILLVLSPMMVLIALLIQLTMPGPIFFQQWRVGENGKLFRIIKFRSMQVNAEQEHHRLMADQAGLHKLIQDPRVTPLGRWMRRYSIDELPQLLNVLRGEMSLVGPRPWALYDALRVSPDLQHRLKAMPGITGAWQVEARSQQLDLNVVNGRDVAYLKTWSLRKDFFFLLRTIPKVLSGSGAC
jgi:lipopolysaccharide/colanic/teichoic acid biosynthesis glycosyltransferase